MKGSILHWLYSSFAKADRPCEHPLQMTNGKKKKKKKVRHKIDLTVVQYIHLRRCSFQIEILTSPSKRKRDVGVNISVHALMCIINAKAEPLQVFNKMSSSHI